MFSILSRVRVVGTTSMLCVRVKGGSRTPCAHFLAFKLRVF